jgi:hypothetical protein
MAGLIFSCTTSEITPTSGAQRTLLQIASPANQRVKVKEWSVSFQGTSNTATPAQVQVMRQSTAGTGGSSADAAPQKWDDDQGETIQSSSLSAATAFSAEPTYGAVLQTENVHTQSGFCWQAPVGGEILLKGGDRLAIVVNEAAGVPTVARFVCEE